MAAEKEARISSSKKRTAKQAAQRKTAAAERAAPLPPRRNCGTMSNHMRLLEMYPSFRDRLFKLEEQTAKYRNTGEKITTVPIVTVKVIVHVVYKDPSQNISDAQIKSQIAVLNRGFPRDEHRQEQDADAVARASSAIRASSSSSIEGHANAHGEIVIQRRQRGEESVHRRHRAGRHQEVPQHVGVRARRRAARLRAVPGRPAGDGRRRDQLHARSARTARRRRRSTRAASRRTRSGTTSTCATSGATRRIAAAPIWWPTRRTAAGPNFGKPTFPTVTCNNGPNGDMFMNYMDYADDDAMFMFTTQQVAAHASDARRSAQRPVVDPAARRALVGKRWVHVDGDDAGHGPVYRDAEGDIPLSRRPRKSSSSSPTMEPCGDSRPAPTTARTKSIARRGATRAAT